MTIAQWQNYFNILQDKYASPYFLNSELSALFNRALVIYCQQFLPTVQSNTFNVEMDRDSLSSLSNIIYELPQTVTSSSGIITKNAITTSLFNTVAASTTPVQFGVITGGTGYVNGTYNNVTMQVTTGPQPLTPLIANIVVAGNTVTSVTYVSGGIGLQGGNVVTSAPGGIPGPGGGFSVGIVSGVMFWRELSIKAIVGNLSMPVSFVRHNDWAQFLNNSFKTPTINNPKVYETALDYRFLPVNSQMQLVFTVLKYPQFVDIDAGISSDMPDYTHDKIISIALQLAGVASRDVAMIELQKARESEV